MRLYFLRTFKQNNTVQYTPDFFVSFWASLADRLGATSSALGSGSFDHGCETGTSAKDLDLGVAFVVGWEIGTVASLGDVGNLGTYI